MKKKIFLFVSILLCTVLLVSCDGKYNKFVKKINKSTETMVSTVTDIKVTDSDILVYRNVKTVELEEEGKAKVTYAESQLNSNFVLEEKKTFNLVEDFNKAEFLSLNLDLDYVKDYEASKNKLVINVAKENLARIFNVGSLEVKEDVSMTLTFANNKIESIISTMVTMSGKTVELSITCAY